MEISNQQDNTTILLKQLAKKIVSSGLQIPAVFFLELHVPFCTIFHNLVLMLEPAATPFFGTERLNNLKTILSDKENIQTLIKLIAQSSRLK